MTIGVLLGAVWGFSKKMDLVMTEVINTVGNVPYTLLIAVLVLVLSPSFWTMVFALTVTGWLFIAYFIRTQVVIIRDREYNLASRCLGTRLWRILFRNIFPYLVSVIILRLALAIPNTIAYETTLTYLGLMDITKPSLGMLLSSARAVFPRASYTLVFPAIIVSIITITFYLVGNAFSDACDPRNHV
jgi:oligopeptide transport system permease protein